MYLGRKGGYNNAAQLFRIDSGLRQRLLRRPDRHTYVSTVGSVMTAFNTGSRPNPLVACVDDFAHIVVGYHLVRNIRCN